MTQSNTASTGAKVRYLDGYGNYGGRGKMLSEAAMCAMRELSPKYNLVRGGKGGPLVSELTVAPISMGDFGYNQTVGYLDFDVDKPKFSGYRSLSFCAPVVGCFDSVAQDFTLSLDEYPIDPPIYMGPAANTGGGFNKIRSVLADKQYAFTLRTEVSQKSVSVQTVPITIATPVGPVKAQPQFDYASNEDIVVTPLSGGETHKRKQGDQPGWDANILVKDIYGADHGIAFPAYKTAAGFGWQSQVGLGNRDPRIALDIWKPEGAIFTRPDFDLKTARSPLEKRPSVVMTASVEFSYPDASQMESYIPSWAPAGSTKFNVWIKPQARAAFSGQFDISAAEGRGASLDVGSTPWRGSDLSMQSNAAGSFSFSIGSGFNLTVEIPIPLSDPITVIDLHKSRLDTIGEGLTFQKNHKAYFASKYDPLTGGQSYSHFKTFKSDLGAKSGTEGPAYVEQCLADTQEVAPELPKKPRATPGNPNELKPETVEVPCNICGYVKWDKKLQDAYGWTHPKDGLFWPISRPQNAVAWKCDSPAKSGCHDTCQLDTKTGVISYVRAPDASDVIENWITHTSYTGDTCLPDTLIVR